MDTGRTFTRRPPGAWIDPLTVEGVEAAIDLTPDRLIGMSTGQARSVVEAAGGFTRVRGPGAPMTYDLVPGRVTLTVSNGIVIEAWADYDAPN